MEKQLLSFHGKQSVKDKYLQRVQKHFDLDEIIKGKYWENGKGCAVGCTIHGSKHDSYEPELGISWRLALVEDSLFEKLPNGEAKKFPLQFLESMPIGVDTNLIFKKFVLWNLADKKEGLIYHVKDQKSVEFLKEVAAIYRRSLKTEIESHVWADLAKRAYASAYASAYAYAYASAYAYAGSGEWQKKFDERILRMRDVLLKLIKTAK